MTEAGRDLKELKDDLEKFIAEHRPALERESTIRHPLEDAAKEARRRNNVVNDGPSHPLGLND